MSLFDETVARAYRAEKALDDAQKRIASLEAQLKAARSDNLQAIRGKWTNEVNTIPRVDPRSDRSRHNDLNSLSDSEVEQMFKVHAEMAEQENAAALKAVAERRKGSSPFLGTIARLLQF